MAANLDQRVAGASARPTSEPGGGVSWQDSAAPVRQPRRGTSSEYDDDDNCSRGGRHGRRGDVDCTWLHDVQTQFDVVDPPRETSGRLLFDTEWRVIDNTEE